MALCAQLMRQSASRCETVMSELMRLCVSSTIIRMRRSRRRSKNADLTSVVEFVSVLGIVFVIAGNGDVGRCIPSRSSVVARRTPVDRTASFHNRRSTLGDERLRVFAVAVGPNLVRQIGLDPRLVVFDRGVADGADGDVVESSAGDG